MGSATRAASCFGAASRGTNGSMAWAVRRAASALIRNRCAGATASKSSSANRTLRGPHARRVTTAALRTFQCPRNALDRPGRRCPVPSLQGEVEDGARLEGGQQSFGGEQERGGEGIVVNDCGAAASDPTAARPFPPQSVAKVSGRVSRAPTVRREHDRHAAGEGGQVRVGPGPRGATVADIEVAGPVHAPDQWRRLSVVRQVGRAVGQHVVRAV